MCLPEQIKNRIYREMHKICVFCEKEITPPNKQFDNGDREYIECYQCRIETQLDILENQSNYAFDAPQERYNYMLDTMEMMHEIGKRVIIYNEEIIEFDGVLDLTITQLDPLKFDAITDWAWDNGIDWGVFDNVKDLYDKTNIRGGETTK